MSHFSKKCTNVFPIPKLYKEAHKSQILAFSAETPRQRERERDNLDQKEDRRVAFVNLGEYKNKIQYIGKMELSDF